MTENKEMALEEAVKETKKAKRATRSKKVQPVVEEAEELDLDKKVPVRSIAYWDTGFSRLMDFTGQPLSISPRATVKLSRNEIIAQVQEGNRLFTGVDGLGNHPTLVIEDRPLLEELGYLNTKVLTNEALKGVFEIRNYESYKSAFLDLVKTRAEKTAVMQMIKDLGLNDYMKIRFAEEYTQQKMSF